jgi:hypothetical protein
VSDFPKAANKWQISSRGGTWPRWRRDGRELFYVEPARRALMAASIATQPSFTPGATTLLFEKGSLAALVPQYDVSADGKRFVILERPTGPPLSIHVVENWYEEYRAQRQRQAR